jgi:hypothetical protein
MSMIKLNVESTIAEEKLIARLRQVFTDGFKNELVDMKMVKHGKAFMSGTVRISKTDASKRVAITACLCNTCTGYFLSLSKDSAKRSEQANRAIKTVYLENEVYRRLDAYLETTLIRLCDDNTIPVTIVPQKDTTPRVITLASVIETPASSIPEVPVGLYICKKRNSVVLDAEMPQYHKEVGAFASTKEGMEYLTNIKAIYESAKSKVNFAEFVAKFVEDEKASA